MYAKFCTLLSQRVYPVGGTAVFGLALTLLLACSSQATVIGILDGEGFESPSYSTGTLEGQVASLPSDAVDGVWQASIGTTSTATVQTAVVESGDQAVRLTRAPNEAPGGGRFGVELSGWPDPAGPVGGRYICIMWDMYVDGPLGVPGQSFGPFFGVEAYDDDGVGLNNGLIGSLGVDATTGDVLYQAAGTGFLTETGTTVSFGEWNTFRIDIDFLLNEYSVFVNGSGDPLSMVPLVTEGFVDGVGLDQFTDAPLATFAAAGDPVSQATGGSAYFDNYKIVQGKIPEPTTLALGMLALVATQGLSRRR